jgi:hypothetical protein
MPACLGEERGRNRGGGLGLTSPVSPMMNYASSGGGKAVLSGWG